MRVGLQQKTRRELGGPFFADYFRSVRSLAAARSNHFNRCSVTAQCS
jgi:hypothetical protein